MKRKLLFIVVLFVNTLVFSQSGIGTQTPDTSAALDLSSEGKGVLFPRITLKSYIDNTTIPDPAVGLIVFNTGLENTFSTSGLFYWDGSEWKQLIGGNSFSAEISLLQCKAATLSPPTYVAGEFYQGSLMIPYVGGNGGSYPSSSIPLPTNNGTLTYTLEGAQLNYGNGTVVFNVSGTPILSSPQLTEFNIDFLGQICKVNVGDVNKINHITYGRNTVSPIDSNTPFNSITTIGNLRVRYNGTDPSQSGFIEYSTVVPTHISWLYRKVGNGSLNVETYGQVAAVPGTWYRFGTGSNSNISTNNRDIGEASLTLHNTQEIYRVSLSANNSINSQNGIPGILSSATIFVEKLAEIIDL